MNATRWHSLRAPPGSAIGRTPRPVSDEIWEAAARHYDEPALAALIIEIALINAWNRLTAITWQPAGSSGPG